MSHLEPVQGPRVSLHVDADDLRHVLNAVGSTRTWLLATLDGGPYGLTFAAGHPDRVHGLILGNTGAKYLEDPTFPEGVPAALRC
jgi:pimeloyl-ACP methyl ester carboxylesterase